MQTHTKPNLLLLVSLFIILLFNVSANAQEIWGMTKYGGEYDKGVIFKMDENALNQEVVFSFETVRSPEGGLTEHLEGVFYGMTSGGGEHDYGVIYRFEAAYGSFTKILDFDGEELGKDGAGRMIFASNGKFYGTTVTGGIHDKGILFEFDPATESFSRKIDFDGQDKGAEPLGSLIEAADGMLYGTTSMGGINDEGVLFSYNISTNNLTKVTDFDGAATGTHPMGNLTETSDGMMYGMTRWGGVNDHGVIFKIDPVNNQFAVVFEFDGVFTGRNPHASLTEASNGKLYGLTPYGGTYDFGVLFEYDPQSGVFLNKYEFTGGVNSGMTPYGSLVEADNGKLYGLIAPNLHYGDMLFEFNPANDNYKMADYPQEFPREFLMFAKSLTLGSNNKLYFIINANQNDIRNENNLYEFDPTADEYTNHFRFSGIHTGEFPHGSLFHASNGKLYGTTNIGGVYNQGVLFKFDPVSYSYSKVLDFDGNLMGSKPNGGVVQANNSKLYGLTREGGAYDKGVLYEMDAAIGIFVKRFDFNGINGEFPDGDFVKAANGKLYGVTTTGGANNEGVFFEFDPVTGSYNKIIDFEGGVNGKEPLSNSLVAASNGSIYGTTLLGGVSDEGVLFEYNPATDNFEKIIDFGGSIPGKVPTNFTQGTDNKLYAHVKPGFIIRFDPANSSYSIVLDDCYIFNPLTGKLLQASNGKFYGMDCGLIWYRATDFTGGIHEFDIGSGTFTQIMEFSWGNGSNPENTSLIQLNSLTAPVAQCKNITLYLDENGQAILEPADIDDGSTGSAIELTLTKSNFTCDDAGENNVVLTVTDENGDTATCTAVVTVEDTIPPVIHCKDIEVFLDASGMVSTSGMASIEAGDIDNGSNDACGIKSMSLNITSFTCEDVGENEVELTVTDNNGNSSFCTAMVTVIDNLAPDVTCISELSRVLEPYEELFIIEDAAWDAVAADNCRIESLEYVINGEIDDKGTSLAGHGLVAGVHEIEWLASDGGGNGTSCLTIIIIEKRPMTLMIIENEIDHEQKMIHVEALLLDDLLVQGVEGKSLVFAIDEASVTAVTNENGVATASIPVENEPTGIYSLTAWFDEDSTYSGAHTESEIVTGTDDIKASAVKIYPNPFTQRLYIEFTANESADARIDLFDAAGRLVSNIFNQPVTAGSFYKVEYRPHIVSSSFFLYRMEIGKSVLNGKVLYGE